MAKAFRMTDQANKLSQMHSRSTLGPGQGWVMKKIPAVSTIGGSFLSSLMYGVFAIAAIAIMPVEGCAVTTAQEVKA